MNGADMTGLDLPGFADPVADAQACFRAVLDAMARPGFVYETGSRLMPPAPLDRATAAVLLTLADVDTPVWLDPDAAAARAWIVFHAGAPIVPRATDAAFAVALSLPEFEALSDGSDEAPEDAATLILQVQALGRGRAFRLFGPGLREPHILAIEGLPETFADTWRTNHARFPRGIDVVLCAGTTLAALPRTVAIEVA